MKKRYQFLCWNCERKYSFLCEISDTLKVIVVCPYCESEAVADFNPYKRPLEIYKGVVPNAVEVLEPPDLIPTQKPTE